MTLDEFCARFGLKGSGEWRRGIVPGSGSKKANLAASEKDGWIQLRDHSGKASKDQILATLGLVNDDLRTGAPTKKTYAYKTRGGDDLFLKTRVRQPNGDKTFLQSGVNGERNVQHLNGQAQKTLYNLPALPDAVIANECIYIVESEACVDLIGREWERVATCQPGGAGKGKWLPEHTAEIDGAAEVRIIADRDPVGEAYATEVYRALYDRVGSVSICSSATTIEHDDLEDHMAAGFTEDELVPRPDLETLTQSLIDDHEDETPAITPYAFTDLGNGERLSKGCGEDFHFVASAKKWLHWDEVRFAVDEQHVHLAAQRTARDMAETGRDLLSKNEDDKYGKQLYSHGRKSESYQSIKNMIAIAATQHGIYIRDQELDANDWILNCKNGVIDLETGKLLPHDRKYLCTLLTPVAYEPSAKCPSWDLFLYEIMNGDEELIDFMQKAIGYSLTGCVREELFFFLHGTGRNGKTTLMNVLQALLGEYGRLTSSDTLMQKSDEGISNDIARLKGARLITSPEIEQGRRLSESKLKDLTSPAKIQARFMYGEFFDFTPTGKIWMYGNHEPVIKGTDDGIWRRMVPIPFDVTIPLERTDHHLIDKLLAELPAILGWAVQGCLRWQKEGMERPQAVLAKTADYRESSDVIGLFLSERTRHAPGQVIAARPMHEAYERWATLTKNRSMSETAFGRAMKDRKDVRNEKVSEGKRYMDIEFVQDLSARYDLRDE